MAKKTGGGPARSSRPASRPASSAWIDLLEEPAAIVDSAGTLVGLNAAFRTLVSDPRAGKIPAAGDRATDWLEANPPLSLLPEPRAAPGGPLRVRAPSGELEARLAALPLAAGGGWLLGLRRPPEAAGGNDFSVMQAVAQGLAYALEPTEAFRRVLDSIGRVLDFEAAACVWAGGPVATGLLRLEAPVDVGTLRGELEAVARELEVRWHPRPTLSVERSLRYRTHDRPFPGVPGFRLVAPLHRAGVAVGLLLLASSSPGLTSEANRRLLLGVANQISLTLERLETSHAAETGKFQAVIDSMPAGVLLLDAAGRLRLANPAARTLFEQLGASSEGNLGTLGGVDLMPLVTEVARSGDPLAGREIEHAGRVLRVSLSQVRGAAFEEPMVLVVAEDVTEQRRVQEQLMRSEKLSSLGEMISGVAHELNNPLATVMGYAQLLLETELPGEVRRMLEVVDSESLRCQKIVQDLLAFARRHPPERRSLNLADVVRRAVELVSYAMRSEGVGIDLDLEEPLPAVLGDAHQLQQVLVNILNNACQAMEPSSGARRVRISARRDRGGARVECRDTGPGIAPEHLPRLFDPFFTTKGVGKGTGLGLSLAYGIVSQHGGSIEARNHPEGGGCFSVWLPAGEAAREAKPAPRVEQEAAPAAEARRATRQAGAPGMESAAAPATDEGRKPGAGRRILIVEDEALLASVMRDALQAEGYAVEVAGDGEQALRRLEAAPFDLVISDIKMPNMGGRELHREILRRVPKLQGRVLFSTGDVVNPATQRFFEETGSRYITKPFKLADLRRLVRALLYQAEAGA